MAATIDMLAEPQFPESDGFIPEYEPQLEEVRDVEGLCRLHAEATVRAHVDDEGTRTLVDKNYPTVRITVDYARVHADEPGIHTLARMIKLGDNGVPAFVYLISEGRVFQNRQINGEVIFSEDITEKDTEIGALSNLLQRGV